jgi:hypothetical protein
MTWRRTTRKLVPWLIGLLVVAQFAGAVPFRQAFASPSVSHTHVHEHAERGVDAIVHTHMGDGATHRHDIGDAAAPSDKCCSLHGLIAIVPVVITAVLVVLVGKPLEVRPPQNFTGITPGRLDRPPRTLLLI